MILNKNNIMQESHNIEPIFNIDKQVICRSLRKNFAPHVKNSMICETVNNKQCIMPRNKVISGKPRWAVENLLLFKSLRAHN